MNTQKRYCPECDRETEQRMEAIKPNDPEAGKVYICTICQESTGLVEDEKLLSRMQHIWTGEKKSHS